MNTLLSWALPIFYFLFSLTLTSIVGLLCYASGRWFNNKAPDIVLAIGFLLGVITVCLILSVPLVAVFTLLLLAVCSIGTFAERAAYPSEQSWGLLLLRMCLATVCSLALSFLCLSVFASRFPLPASELFHEPWFLLGVAVGMLFSPSVIPVFVWLYKSSRLRPGVEITLESNETVF